jgi:hypothetical protein
MSKHILLVTIAFVSTYTYNTHLWAFLRVACVVHNKSPGSCSILLYSRKANTFEYKIRCNNIDLIVKFRCALNVPILCSKIAILLMFIISIVPLIIFPRLLTSKNVRAVVVQNAVFFYHFSIQQNPIYPFFGHCDNPVLTATIDKCPSLFSLFVNLY